MSPILDEFSVKFLNQWLTTRASSPDAAAAAAVVSSRDQMINN